MAVGAVSQTKQTWTSCVVRSCVALTSSAAAVIAVLLAWLAGQALPAHPVPREGLRPAGPIHFANQNAVDVANLIYIQRLPDGLPAEDDFGIAAIPLQASLGEGQVRVRTRWLSVDPYMRHRMSGGASDLPPLTETDIQDFEKILHRIPGGENIGVVVESNASTLPVGLLVRGIWQWSDLAVLNQTQLEPLESFHTPASAALGALGMPGRTAYNGLHKVLKGKPGEVLFVTGAAGATGAVVGQLAKAAGLRVLGSAGTDEKVQYLLELGFDGAFNYRKEDPYKALSRLAPDGIDLFFENTGGLVSEAVLHNLRHGARVAVCGVISWYNQGSDQRLQVKLAAFLRAMMPSSWSAARAALVEPWSWPRALTLKVVAHALLPLALAQAGSCSHVVQPAPALARTPFTYEGFIVTCYDGAGQKQHVEAELAASASKGHLRIKEDILKGSIADVPTAFIRMMTGKNFGKQLVELVGSVDSD